MAVLWVLVFVTVFAWSAIRPHDTFTWFLEVLPGAVLSLLMLGRYHDRQLVLLRPTHRE